LRVVTSYEITVVKTNVRQRTILLR